MTLKKRNLLGGFNRFRLMLTLVLAVLLPAGALIYINFSELIHFKRDKVLEAYIHRDFQEMLAISEKEMNKKVYEKVQDTEELFPSLAEDEAAREKKLDDILAKCSCFDHAFVFDGDELTFYTQTAQ